MSGNCVGGGGGGGQGLEGRRMPLPLIILPVPLPAGEEVDDNGGRMWERLGEDSGNSNSWSVVS